MISLICLVFFNVAICLAKGSDKDGYLCGPAGYVCYPANYTRGLPKQQNDLTLYTAVISADTAVKQVNEHEMVLTYEPHILLIWQDPRLKFFNIIERQIMPDEMADKIWIPKIAVEEQVITMDNSDGDIG